MRIFVTGATGFIGGHFVERALAAGHEVIGIHTSTSIEKLDFVSHLRSLGARMERGSILDPDTLSAPMTGVECVCHFAAAFRENAVEDEHFRRLNVTGLVNVAKAAAAAGVKRFVSCSTAGIYGQRVPHVIDESAKPKPWNIYEQTKLEGEAELRRLASELQFEYVIVRPTAVYGPRDERLLKLFRSAAKGKFPLFGKGEGRRHMVYVTDLAEAFLRACTEPGAANEELIIGGPRAVRLADLLNLLAMLLNRKTCGPTLPLKPMLVLAAITEDVCKVVRVQPPLYRRRMDFYLNDAEFSSARAQKILKWRPLVDLPQGLASTLEDYSRQGWVKGHSSLATRAALVTLASLAGAQEMASIAGTMLA